MKAIFVAYNQAYNEEIVEVLVAHGQRGYTAWQDIQGKGSVDGIPHLGNHAWPEMNHVMLSFVEDDDVARKIVSALRETDSRLPDLGLRVFSWSVDPD